MSRSAGALLVLLLSACAQATAPGASSSAPGQPVRAGESGDDALARVAMIHGGAGPWAVAGYRMGAYAMGRLGLEPRSFDLEVVHHTPQEVQYSCIADGAAAATGASVGRLSLRLADAAEADVRTTYLRKSTGQSVTLRPAAAFAARFRDVPRDKLGEAGRIVMGLPDADVFEEAPAAPTPSR